MQKEKLKKQKGITLIALIITIIVMLILVGVTVTVALQGGLFNTAKDAAQKTAEAARRETEMLRYEYEIAKVKGETDAESFTEYVLDTKYSGLEIGDYVNYNELSNGTKEYTPNSSKGIGATATQNSATGKYDITTQTPYSTENLGWRVLGVNEIGDLELISDKPTSGKIIVKNVEGYINLVQVLNEMSNTLYGQGEYARSARSLNYQDINTLTGYDPEISEEKYGDEYTYSKESDGYIYVNGTKTSDTVFNYIDEKSGKMNSLENEGDSTTINDNYYGYEITNESVKELISGGLDNSFTVAAYALAFPQNNGYVSYFAGLIDCTTYAGLRLTGGPQVGPSYATLGTHEPNVYRSA